MSALGDYLRLSASTGLRSLQIRLLDLTEEFMFWVPWVLMDLAQPGGPHLKCITFDIWFWNARQLQSRNWNEIERILHTPCYAALEDVTFIQRGHLDMAGLLDFEAAKSILSRRFSSLEQRGILHVLDGMELVGVSKSVCL